MTYLISVLWFPLLLALALGAIVGLSSFAREPRSETAWLYLAGVIVPAAILLAAFKAFAGRAGLWLDATLLLVIAYFIGCLLGAWFRSRSYEPAGQFAPVAAKVAVPAAVMPRPAAPPMPVAAPVPAPAAVAEPAPAATTPVAFASPEPVPASAGSSVQPSGIPKPRGGQADDLKRVRGIGKQNEGRLHALGIWHFDQIAAWTEKEIDWVEGFLAFPGRIQREDWVGQAKVLASGGQTEFSQRVARGEVETSADDGSQGQANIDRTIDPQDHNPQDPKKT
jgi:predicted flap endonuclease-1-like 5' DNA nuclease